MFSLTVLHSVLSCSLIIILFSLLLFVSRWSMEQHNSYFRKINLFLLLKQTILLKIY